MNPRDRALDIGCFACYKILISYSNPMLWVLKSEIPPWTLQFEWCFTPLSTLFEPSGEKTNTMVSA